MTLQKIGSATNATKAQIIATANAIFALLVTFHVALTSAQIGSIDLAMNAVLALFVALTYTQSALRVQTPPAPGVGGDVPPSAK